MSRSPSDWYGANPPPPRNPTPQRRLSDAKGERPHGGNLSPSFTNTRGPSGSSPLVNGNNERRLSPGHFASPPPPGNGGYGSWNPTPSTTPSAEPLETTMNNGVVEWQCDFYLDQLPTPPTSAPVKSPVYISSNPGTSMRGGDSAGYEWRQQAISRSRSVSPAATFDQSSLPRSPSPFISPSAFSGLQFNFSSISTSTGTRGGTTSTGRSGTSRGIANRHVNTPNMNGHGSPPWESEFFDISNLVQVNQEGFPPMVDRTTTPGDGSEVAQQELPRQPPPPPPLSAQSHSRDATWHPANQSGKTRPGGSPVLFPVELTESRRRLNLTRVLSVVVVAEAPEGLKAVPVPAPPLAPLVEYDTPPQLHPVEDKGAADLSQSTTNREGEGLITDELVKVSYQSGLTASGATSLQVMKEQFLSGHNAMLFLGNTPRTTCLAEDLLSTYIASIYAASESMGPNIINELTISAYGVMMEEGLVANLLPTNLAETNWQPARLMANPVAGIVINNYQPVYVWAADQARYLSRGLVRNARVMEADPSSNNESVIWVTLLLKQTRLSVTETSEYGVSTSDTGSTLATTNSRAYVYLSSLHIIFSGYNMPLVDELLQHESLRTYPLIRHAFGGQCCTAVLVMVDETDNRERTRPLFDVASARSQIENMPPHSGSVIQFLHTISASLSQSGDRGDSNFANMQEDAIRLLDDPCADIPFYTSENKVDTRPYHRAHQVVMLEAPQSTPRSAPQLPKLKPEPEPESEPEPEPELMDATRRPSSEEQSTPLVRKVPAAAGPASDGRSAKDANSEAPTDSSYGTIRVNMPPTVKERETVWHALQNMRREHDAKDAEQWPALHMDPGSLKRARGLAPSEAGSYGNSRLGLVQDPNGSVKLVKAGNRTESVILLDVPPGNPQAEPVVCKQDETHVRVCVPMRKTASILNLTNGPSFDSTQTSGSNPEKEKEARCRFRADALREVTRTAPTPGTTPGDLSEMGQNRDRQLAQLVSMPEVCAITSAFVAEQRNTALLATSCLAGVQPFLAQPIWGYVGVVLNDVMTSHRRRRAHGDPTTLALFASLLSGRQLVRDLADPDSPVHPAEYVRAEVGMSPLFGPLLYATRSVDLSSEVDAGVVLTSMLERADETAGTNPDPYIVMTCVQKTTYQLKPEEMSDVDKECGYEYDAIFSSFTVVSTRNSTRIFRDCVHREVVDYPICLLTDAVHGATKTLCVLHADTIGADPASVMDALLAHNRMISARKLAPRSGRVRAYINECVLAMNKLEEKAQGAYMTRQERDKMQERFDAFDAMAREHEVYLSDSKQEGYVLYPGRTDAPGVVDPNATRDTASTPLDGGTLTEAPDDAGQMAAAATSPPPTTRDTRDGDTADQDSEYGPDAASRDTAAPKADGNGAAVPSQAERAVPTPLDRRDTGMSGSVRTVDTMPPLPVVTTTQKQFSAIAAEPPRGHVTSRSTTADATQPTTASADSDSRTTRTSNGVTSRGSRDAAQEHIADTMRPSVAHRSAPTNDAQQHAVAQDGSTGPQPAQSTAQSSLPGESSGGGGTDPSERGKEEDEARRAPAAAEQAAAPLSQFDAFVVPSPQESDELSVSVHLANDSAGIVVHSMALLMHVKDGTTTEAQAQARGEMLLQSPKRGELRLMSFAKDTLQDFQLDEIVELQDAAQPGTTAATTAAAVNPAHVKDSEVLRSAVGSFLSGSNAAVLMQATETAEAALLPEHFIARVLHMCLRNRPSEVEFFFSAALIAPEATAMVDLLQATSPIPDDPDEEQVDLSLGFSPVAGPMVNKVKFVPLYTVEDTVVSLRQVMQADRLRASRYGPRLLAMSVLQKTVIEAERDVSVGSLLLLIGRGHPRSIQFFGSSRRVTPLIHYALTGQCLSVCVTAVTDKEPEGSSADAALVHQQGTLCGFSGKPITYNSYADLLRHHREQLAFYNAKLNAIQVALSSGKPLSDEERSALEVEGITVKRHCARYIIMARDEERMLTSRGVPGVPPPIYPL